MALSGLDIYKLLPKTNCKECGFATCLAFAMQLAKKAVSIDKCPHVGAAIKKTLEEASLPPIKLVSIGSGEGRFDIGQESVMFRHEEKFHHPCGIGFVIDDSAGRDEIQRRVSHINGLHFERVGQSLNVNFIAIRQKTGAQSFLETIKLVSGNTKLALMLISDDLKALEEALAMTAALRPVIYHATPENAEAISVLAKHFNVPLVVSAPDLERLTELTTSLNTQGAGALILDTGKQPPAEKLWDLTQIRRQALKKSNRALGYPTLAIIETPDPYEAALEAAVYIAKYAGLLLLESADPAQTLALLTARQNIYTDPQKPLQIDAGLYPVGQVSAQSPVLVTTNFSLTYYTVLGEVEASKVPAHILSVNTEGMSVLTAWAAEKFNPEKITEALSRYNAAKAISRKRLVLPGYVAMMSGDLQETSGWEVLVGPKEASGLPAFLKNLTP